MPERSRSTEVEYHLRRARSERDVAYRSANELAADAHMRLSALHLQRALLLRAVDCGPVGNIHPFRTPAITECRPMPAADPSCVVDRQTDVRCGPQADLSRTCPELKAGVGEGPRASAPRYLTASAHIDIV
jgi:hypothetical protein